MAAYQERRVECYEIREYGSQPYQTYSYSDKTGDFFGGQSQAQLHGRSDSNYYQNSGATAAEFYGGGTETKKTSGEQFQSQGQAYRSDSNYYQNSGATAAEFYGGGTARKKTSGEQFQGQGQAYRSDSNYYQGSGGATDFYGYNKICGPQTETLFTSDPFFDLVPSAFPPGTDQKVIDTFNRIDKDRSGLISDMELKSALSGFSQSFHMRTVHLLMYIFTGTNTRNIGPKEFVPLLNNLQSWKATFQRFDRNRNGSIDVSELREALHSLGFSVTPVVLNLLIAKFDKSGAKCSIQYDNFIECCLTIKGLTEKYRAKECSSTGTATFTYEEFLLSVLPFIIA